MSGRTYIKDSILLCGKGDNGSFPRTFFIDDMIGDGASTVNYTAHYENSTSGVLKEFYPKDPSNEEDVDRRYYALVRDEEQQLMSISSIRQAYENFESAKQEFVEPYNMLLNAMTQEGNGDVLGTFIPPIEIYYGCDKELNANGTVYIWMPNKAVVSFERVCENIHANPDVNPEESLYLILNSIRSLTDCVCALHSAGLIHRDIKPSNFGFTERNGKPLYQSLTMFDVDTICPVLSRKKKPRGTQGFCAPQTRVGYPAEKDDIYSIGATLFYAMIISDEAKQKGYVYESDMYGRMKDLVIESKLISVSERNSHPLVRNKLTEILKKCLTHNSAGRYTACEELRRALDDVIGAMMMNDAKSALDRNRNKNSKMALRYHLYNNPLYKYAPKNASDIRVLIVGFGDYGEKFLDICLQIGQIRNKALKVTVVSQREKGDDYKNIYLNERPALAEFFNVDGSLEGKNEESYGDVNFRYEQFTQSVDENRQLINELFNEQRIDYVFVACGNDELNLSVAKQCAEVVGERNAKCLVSFAWDGSIAPVSKRVNGEIPVYINADVKKQKIYRDVERMAFNSHLIWQGNSYPDYNKTHTEFNREYYHISSVSVVLSIKYKLYSVGIDIDKCNIEEAASEFNRKLNNKAYSNVINELVWCEHRRWVAEKLCGGWTRLTDYACCMTGKDRDDVNKKHVCIVKSRPDTLLQDKFSGVNHSKWDNPTKADLDELDELDRMSVELHLAYKASAEKAIDQISGPEIYAIRALLVNHRKAMAAFNEWHNCLKEICNRDYSKVGLQAELKAVFEKCLDYIPESVAEVVKAQLKAFNTLFYPVLASLKYTDYKRNDIEIVENIPFILTYSEAVNLVVPLETGDNNEVFSNVAAVSGVNPAKVIYLYHIDKETKIKALYDAAKYVSQYILSKNLNSVIEFVITYEVSANIGTDSWIKTVKEELIKRGENVIKLVDMQQVNYMEEIPVVISKLIKQKLGTTVPYAVEKNDTNLSWLLYGGGFYRQFPSYKFDSRTIKFLDMENCDILKYIKRKPYIRVSDMTAFKCSDGETGSQPEFFDSYTKLWKYYSSVSGDWKGLCNELENKLAENDTIVSFPQKRFSDAKGTVEEYRYVLPITCSKAASKVITALLDNGIIEEGSKVNSRTAESCEVIIRDRYGYKKEHSKLFASMDKLMLHQLIDISLKDRKVSVIFNDLTVRHLQFKEKYKDYLSILKYLEENGYIINLSVEGDNISFTFSTYQVKDLLTSAGKILEVYTYHKARETGQFDDIVNGYELKWYNTEVKNEFDCILTRGFNTLFVECKARKEISQDFYFKISGLAKKFGINAHIVLVADTQDGEHCSLPNELQMKRGRMLDVITVWKRDEINNIGYTLLSIINGKYSEEDIYE